MKQSSGPSPHGWHRLVNVLQCDKKFQLAEVRGVKVPLDQTPPAFAQGLLFHAMRDRWFKCEFSTSTEAWNECLLACIQAMEACPAPVAKVDEQAALILFEAYINHYKDLPSPTPIASEYEVGPVKLSESDPANVVFTARLDDVSRYPEAGGRLYVGESKTCSDFGNTVKEYQVHGQPILQTALWKAAEQGERIHGPVHGVMLDMIRKPQGTPGQKGYKKPAFLRQSLEVTERTLDWYVPMIREAKKRSLQIKWDSNVPRNVTACTFMAGRARIACPYRDLCTHGHSAAGEFVYGPDGKRVWDWTPEYDTQVKPWD